MDKIVINTDKMNPSEAAAERAVELVCRALRVCAGVCYGLGRVSSDGVDAGGYALALDKGEGDGCGVGAGV